MLSQDVHPGNSERCRLESGIISAIAYSETVWPANLYQLLQILRFYVMVVLFFLLTYEDYYYYFVRGVQFFNLLQNQREMFW